MLLLDFDANLLVLTQLQCYDSQHDDHCKGIIDLSEVQSVTCTSLADEFEVILRVAPPQLFQVIIYRFLILSILVEIEQADLHIHGIRQEHRPAVD